MFALLKGWFGEKAVQFGLWNTLDAKVYQRIHDVILPASNGGSTQIDHIYVSIYGIFVIETKNLKGWIFADEHSREWTQCIFGQKYRFQNPLHQNYRHVKCLAESLSVSEDRIHPVVFFVGNCHFKTGKPKGVLTSGLTSYIRCFSKPMLTIREVGEIIEKLRKQKRVPTITKRAHVASLHVRHAGNNCPKCGSPLIERIARKGARCGERFLGCSTYPQCRFTRSVRVT